MVKASNYFVGGYLLVLRRGIFSFPLKTCLTTTGQEKGNNPFPLEDLSRHSDTARPPINRPGCYNMTDVTLAAGWGATSRSISGTNDQFQQHGQTSQYYCKTNTLIHYHAHVHSVARGIYIHLGSHAGTICTVFHHAYLCIISGVKSVSCFVTSVEKSLPGFTT